MSNEPVPPPDDLPEQMQVRRGKLDRLVTEGIDPYPVGHPRTTSIGELRAAFPDLEPGTETGRTVSVTGRVVLNRPGGKLLFATVQEGGERVQVMLQLDRLGADSLAAWKSDVDLGDHVGVTGEVIATRKGELSVRADSWALTSKALRPLPDKHHGLTDPEARVRARYLDLVVNPDARRLLELRSATLTSVRASLAGRGFVEVDTPMLQPVHGGATARPFVTHMNALDLPLYLRIAPELYLKRLVVGGIDKVFELGRNFRNEGVDTSHNPEFTTVEFYEAYGDYDTGAALTRSIVQEAARALHGGEIVPTADGGTLDLSGDWHTVTLHGSVSAAVGVDVTPDTPVEELRRIADKAAVALQPQWDAGAVVLELYEKLVEHALVAPTFVRDFPVEVSPLVRRHRSDPRLAERWDLVVLGRELGTGYSELVDPVDQRRRLTEQSLLAAGGDVEAMALDEDFLRALEHGMPPTGGVGIGIERLLMVLTGTPSIRDVILFPLVRPQ